MVVAAGTAAVVVVAAAATVGRLIIKTQRHKDTKKARDKDPIGRGLLGVFVPL